MSKSNGEFLTVSLLETKGYNPLAYRLLCLQSHYHKQLVFTYESLEGATNAYNKLLGKIRNISKDDSIVDEELVNEYKNKFKKELENDLNTSNAITILYDVLKSDLNNNTKLYLIEDFDKVLSLDLLKKEEIDKDLLGFINKKIEERKQAKADKDYNKADAIRKELEEKGIILKDTREGTTFEIN